MKNLQPKRILNILLIVSLCSTMIFSGCSSNLPKDYDLLEGTAWISVYQLPAIFDLDVQARGNYLFATPTSGVWKATINGVPIPLSNKSFVYSYHKGRIKIIYDNGKTETGTIKRNTMMLRKDNGIVINYVWDIN